MDTLYPLKNNFLLSPCQPLANTMLLSVSMILTTLGTFHTLATVNNSTTNTGVQISLQDPAFNLFGIYPEVGLLGHMVIIFLISWGTTILFFTATLPFYSPTNNALGSHFSKSCQDFFSSPSLPSLRLFPFPSSPFLSLSFPFSHSLSFIVLILMELRCTSLWFWFVDWDLICQPQKPLQLI